MTSTTNHPEYVARLLAAAAEARARHGNAHGKYHGNQKHREGAYVELVERERDMLRAERDVYKAKLAALIARMRGRK